MINIYSETNINVNVYWIAWWICAYSQAIKPQIGKLYTDFVRAVFLETGAEW